MRAFLKSNGRWLRAGLLWPLVLLALPKCSEIVGIEDWNPRQGSDGRGNKRAFDPGHGDLSRAVMCDIPLVTEPSILCATDPMDLMSGMPKAHAAVALAQSDSTISLVLDFSQDSQNACGAGVPRKLFMYGPFPDGYPVCLNCQTQIPQVYANANEVCIAQCIDLVNFTGADPPEGVDAYCATNAHVSTNFEGPCYENVCSTGGTPGNPNFVDPRREQEPVDWTDFHDTSAMGNTLKGTTGIPIPDVFTAGAASVQRITTGDAWVEFAAGQNDVSHVLGLALDTAQDNDPTLADIVFAISLNFDNKVYILESGNVVAGPIVPEYTPGERFRVRIKDNNDSTATITATRLDCSVTPCGEAEIGTQTAPSFSYKLRVDASFREADATLEDVRIVRIKE